MKKQIITTVLGMTMVLTTATGAMAATNGISCNGSGCNNLASMIEKNICSGGFWGCQGNSDKIGQNCTGAGCQSGTNGVMNQSPLGQAFNALQGKDQNCKANDFLNNALQKGLEKQQSCNNCGSNQNLQGILFRK